MKAHPLDLLQQIHRLIILAQLFVRLSRFLRLKELHLLWVQVPRFLRLINPQALHFLLLVKVLVPRPGLQLTLFNYQYLVHQNSIHFLYFLALVQLNPHE